MKALLTLLASVTLFVLASPAQAVTCTLTGTVELWSQDAYYCDTEVLGDTGCSGWKEVDLDEGTVPLQYMAVGIFSQSGAFLKQTTTDSTGHYSATFELGGTQCAGQTVELRLYFARAHESDVGLAAPRWRFWVTHLNTPTPPNWPVPDGDLWAWTGYKQLTGSTSEKNRTWFRQGGPMERVANVYFTASEYVKEAKNWSSNLNARFTYGPLTGPILYIGVEESWPNGGAYGPYMVVWGWEDYAGGGGLRHELGHVTHFYAHKLERDYACHSQKFKGVEGHHPRGCEYGPMAVTEGIASFFATRSVTSNDTKSWFCSCHDGASETQNWDVCSERAALTSDPDGDTDWLYGCGTNALGVVPGDFWYLGDHRVSSTSNCTRLVFDFQCECPGGSTWDPAKGWSWCNSTSEGWRNEVQVSRFFWDTIDNNDDSGLDDTNMNIVQFIAGMEAMPCAGNLAGVDGSCEEHAVPPTRPMGHPLGPCGFGSYSACTCKPSAEGASTPTGTGTRDAYNIYDLSDFMPGGQTGERTLNCGQNAPD
jgi:hypothetical protein